MGLPTCQQAQGPTRRVMTSQAPLHPLWCSQQALDSVSTIILSIMISLILQMRKQRPKDLP